MSESTYDYGNWSSKRPPSRRELTHYKSPKEVERDIIKNSEQRRATFEQLIAIATQCRSDLAEYANPCTVYNIHKPLTNVCVALSDFIVKLELLHRSGFNYDGS